MKSLLLLAALSSLVLPSVVPAQTPGHLAWVTFDFEFLEDGRVENHGVEVWQMVRNADDAWKILSVVWSSNGAPR